MFTSRFNYCAIVANILLLVLVIGTSFAATDTDLPSSISSISPAKDANSVKVDGEVSVTFSRAMDKYTITPDNFKLLKVVVGGLVATRIEGAVTYKDSKAYFRPYYALDYNREYVVEISSYIQDNSGGFLESDYSWSFKTQPQTVETKSYWDIHNWSNAQFTNNISLRLSSGTLTGSQGVQTVFTLSGAGKQYQKIDGSGNLLHYGKEWESGSYYIFDTPEILFPKVMTVEKVYKYNYTRKEYDTAGKYHGDGSSKLEIVVTGPFDFTLTKCTYNTYKYSLKDEWADSWDKSGTSTIEYWVAEDEGLIGIRRNGVDSMLLDTDKKCVVKAPNIKVSPSTSQMTADTGTSKTQKFTIANSGNDNLKLGLVSISSINSAFSITNDNCSYKTLSPTGSCTFDAVFSPEFEGVKEDAIEIFSDDPDTPDYILPLTGTAEDSNKITLSGRVLFDGSPVCAMVLANGQYMFSCEGEGKFDLKVPLDDKGEVILFAFVDGLAPYKQTVKSGEAGNVIVNMSPASEHDPEMDLIDQLDATIIDSKNVKLKGKVMFGETPLCAMVLANGQYEFSCNGHGEYELEAPLDEKGEITIFGFCDGFKPFKYVLKVLDT